MASSSQNALGVLTERLEGASSLDGIASAVQSILGPLTGETAARQLLSGQWLGHALHPILTDVPIGAWTSALILDAIGGASSEHAAEILLGVGVAAVAPTALSGWSDWGATATAEQRRVGLLHAVANIAAASFFAASLLRRRQGRRRAGKLLGLGGAATLSVGGYLGGHLSYARGTGVGPR